MAGVLLAAAAILSGCQNDIKDGDIQPISALEVQRLIGRSAGSKGRGLLLIDPRSPRAYAEGHLPGARHMQIAAVPVDADRDPELEKFDTLVVYGDNPASPPASAMTKRLLAAGYKRVRLFMGGLAEWRANGYPVETSPTP